MITIPTKQAFGYNDLMVTSAHHYCLGRRTYIVSVCVDWLKENWHLFQQNTRNMIVDETKWAILKDVAGDECDVELWKSLIKFAEGDK